MPGHDTGCKYGLRVSSRQTIASVYYNISWGASEGVWVSAAERGEGSVLTSPEKQPSQQFVSSAEQGTSCGVMSSINTISPRLPSCGPSYQGRLILRSARALILPGRMLSQARYHMVRRYLMVLGSPTLGDNKLRPMGNIA